MDTSQRFTELDFLAWIAAAVFILLPLTALLLSQSPDSVSRAPAVPPIEQDLATAYLPPANSPTSEI
jgi:hypothetical protein